MHLVRRANTRHTHHLPVLYTASTVLYSYEYSPVLMGDTWHPYFLYRPALH